MGRLAKSNAGQTIPISLEATILNKRSQPKNFMRNLKALSPPDTISASPDMSWQQPDKTSLMLAAMRTETGLQERLSTFSRRCQKAEADEINRLIEDLKLMVDDCFNQIVDSLEAAK